MIIKVTPKGLIYFQIIFSILYKILELVGLEVEKLNYVLHFIALYLLFFMVKDQNRNIRKYIKDEVIAMVVLFAVTISGIFVVPLCYSDIMFQASLGVYIKGMLNFYRYFIFFFATIKYLSYDDIKKVYDILEKIFILNILLSFFEYFVLGCEQDFLGGIFGITYGGNVGLNIFLCFFATIYILRYLNKKVKLPLFIFVEVICILIATMAELKIYYIEIAVIMVIAILLVKPNKNTIKIIIAFVLIMAVGIYALSIIFPKQLDILLNSSKFSTYAGGSYVSGSLGRMTMFQELEGIFFKDYPLVRFLGFGIGTFDPSSNSYWAEEYSYLRAGWFSNSIILLNFGYVGLVTMYLFYINLIRKAFVWRKNFKEEKIYFDIAIVMLVIILITMWYNQTILSGTIAYLLYFVIAVPIILYKRKVQNDMLIKEKKRAL